MTLSSMLSSILLVTAVSGDLYTDIMKQNSKHWLKGNQLFKNKNYGTPIQIYAANEPREREVTVGDKKFVVDRLQFCRFVFCLNDNGKVYEAHRKVYELLTKRGTFTGPDLTCNQCGYTRPDVTMVTCPDCQGTEWVHIMSCHKSDVVYRELQCHRDSRLRNIKCDECSPYSATYDKHNGERIVFKRAATPASPKHADATPDSPKHADATPASRKHADTTAASPKHAAAAEDSSSSTSSDQPTAAPTQNDDKLAGCNDLRRRLQSLLHEEPSRI